MPLLKMHMLLHVHLVLHELLSGSDTVGFTFNRISIANKLYIHSWNNKLLQELKQVVATVILYVKLFFQMI